MSYLKAVTGLLNPNSSIDNDREIEEMFELSKSINKVTICIKRDFLSSSISLFLIFTKGSNDAN